MADAAVETAAPDDIRSALAAAFEQTEQPAEAPKVDAKETPAAETGEAPELPLEEKSERERGPDGKFIKKAEATEEAAEPVEPAEKAETETEKAPAPETQRFVASLNAADKEMFQKLPPDAQQFFERRYKQMQGDYTKKLEGVSRLKTDYDPVDKMFEPYRDVMKQKGFTPAKLIESWANVEKDLASGEDSAIRVVRGLVSGYNIPLPKLAAALGIRAGAAPTQQAAPQAEPAQQQQPVQLPPEITQALQELGTLKQTVNGLTAAQRAAIQSAQSAAGERAMQEIEKFKSAVDDKGTLLHPHFEELEQDMLDLAQGLIAAKKTVPPLPDLYEKAAWANPSVREKLRSAEKQAAEKTRADQERAKAVAAKKAAASVTGTPGSGQAPSVRGMSEKSLREQLEEAAAEQAA